jgi:phosphoserine aminotransferase
MNVCFVMNDATLEESFLAAAKANNIVGIKGHRLVGGFRASLYNALPISSVHVLVDTMQAFTKQHA